ncbi:MAG TPA: pyruvate formate lyase family protein, partial [Clostridia bacterium]|nr:pyruvate formate lyase family protein [Clostridia bacterium]
SNRAVIAYANRYAAQAEAEALTCPDPARRAELVAIAARCRRVPAQGARTFAEACQSFWFLQMLLQIESSGHSISPGRFDQYMYPYYKEDIKAGKIAREQAQEFIDCIYVKLND